MGLRWRQWLSTGRTGEGGAIALSSSPLIWRVLGALVLGVLLARWSWVLFAPHSTAIAVVPERGVTADAGRLFGTAVSVVSPSEGIALPNVHLTGVFAARAGQSGFAVLKLDDKRQVGVAVGESVVPGTKLLEVHLDYVLLERAGMRQRVDLDGKAAGADGVLIVPAVR